MGVLNKENNMMKIISVIILYIYISIMIIASLIPGDNLQSTIIPIYSGVLHFIGFFILAFIGTIVFYLYDSENPILNLIQLIVFMSGLTEGIQYFVPGRVFSIMDFCVNIIGGITFIFIILISSLLFSRKEGPL